MGRSNFVRAWCAHVLCWCMLCLPATSAFADICKYVDGEGNMNYTNVPPGKGWKKVSCGVGGDGPRRTDGGSKSTASTPSGFPYVDSNTQKGRDDMRRK